MADGSGLDDEDVPERFRHLLKVSKEEEALRLKLYPDVSVIEELKIQCTICLKDVKHIFLLKKKSYKHFILQVVVCKSCMKFYGDGDFSTEEDGDDKYCRWCGQGGTLYLCSKCPSAFCKKCIKQNLERKFILLVQRDDWCCFVCEPTPLYKLRALSWAVDQHLKNEELKEKEAEKRREKLKNTPKVNTNKTRKSLPSFDLSENYFQAHVDSTKVWLKGLTDKINPGDIATTRFNDCANLIPSLSSPSDFTNLSESLVNYVDHQMDALLNFRNELIKGLSKLKHNFERSQRRVHPRMTEGSECEEAMDVDDEECAKTQNGDHESAVGTPADNGDDMEATVDSHLGNGDNMEATVDSHLGNGDNMEATVDSHLGNGDNMDASVDSNADMFGDNSLKEENVSGGRPLIRLRNLSDLIAPGLKKVDSPKRKQGEKSELILLSSDDDEPARVTKDKGVSAKKQNSEEDQVVNPKALKKTSLKLVSKKPEDSGNKTGSGSTEDRQGESTPALVDKKSRRRGKSVESSTEEDQETQNLVENPKAKKLREKLKGKSDNKSGEFTRDESVNKKLKDKLERNSSKKSDEVTRDESVTDEKSDKERGRQSNKKSNQEANDKKSSDEVSQRKFFSSSESEDNESSNERGSKSLKKRTKIDSKSKGQRKDDSTADDDSQPKLFTSSENEDSAPVKKNSSEKDGKKKKDKDKTIEKSETSKKKIFTSSESEPDRAKETAKKKKDKDRTSEKSEPSKKKIFTSSESEQGCDKGTAGEKLKKGVGKMASTAQASKGSTSSSDIDKIGRKSEPPKKKVFTSSESEPDCKKGTVKEKLKKGGGKVTSTPKVALKTSQASEDSASSSEVDKIGEKSEPAKKKIFTSSESEPDCAKGTAENKKDKDKTSEKSDPSKKKIFTSSEGEPDHAKGTVKEKLKKGVGKTASTPKVALKTAQASEDSSSSSGVEKIGEKSEPSKKKIASSESEPDRAKGTVKGKLKKGLGKTTSTPRVALKTAQASEDSTSSSDPLSESSGDNKKKKSPKKVNRSYFSASDSDDERRGKKTEIKKTKKKKKKAASTTDSEVNTEDLLRKKKKSSSTLSKSKKNAQQPKKSKKQVADSDSDDDDDYNIAKLCDFKSLLRKRAHSSGDLTLSEDEDVDKKKERTAAKKKQKKDGDPEETLEDFYDSKDEQEGDEQEMEDLDDTFRREFSHISERYIDDLKGEFLKLSSSDEEKGRSSPEEDKETKKKRKKKPAAQKSKEGRKGKKQYADKLMKMKLDSDSDDLEKGEKKYEQHKKRQAEKKDDSSDDDMPGIKDDPKKKRAAPRKKMFSDSDVSEDDADSEKESTKRSENGSKADSDSDFDDKEEEKSQKQSDSDSDSSVEIKSKKRKRIRRNRGSSSSEDDSDGSGKRRSKKDKLNDSKGRKNIKKILKEDDLKQTTQAALKAEQERKKRIQEKQKLYNQLMQPADELSKHTELTELVLDFNAKTKEKLVVVDSDLVKKLKPHQAEGVKFMWDSCFESLAMTKKKTGSGCILAHCMGLGKSLQVVTLVHTLIMHPEIGVRKVMVVAPLSTVLNWVNEFDKWLKDVGSGQDVNVFHMNKTQPSYRSFLLKDWDRQGGVLIMGYNLLRSLTNPKARMKAAFKKVFQEQLVDPGPDVIICDEGHILKNEKTAINQCMTKIKTRRRIVLTGTPLQNNLVEYHCMVQFVKPNLLGTKKEFTNRFVNPITNGQFEDSTPHDVKIMKRRAHVLHTMLDGLVQRKDYNVLTPYLPPKFEYVIHLKLSDVQVKLYRHYLLNMVHGGTDTGEAPKGKRLFVDFQNLMWICLHPRTLLMKADKDEKKAMMEESDEEGSLKDFIDDGKSTSESDFKTGSSSGAESGSDASVKSIKPAKRKTRGQGSVSDTEELPAQTTKQWWSDLIEEADMVDIRTSSKLFLFFTILKYCEEIGDKLLVFSQSLYTLDIIEYFLDKIDVETQKPEEERCPGIKGFEGSWAKGLDYFRLDGSSACENRESWCKSFNRGENKARLFLISTRAGGLGINLTGANRVIIFDASWNPSFDVQSLFRVYRFGQEKPCYIYRFLSKGTMEEKIYERQVAKLSTSLRVIDEHQIDRHFSHSALAELYMFDPEGSELQGTPVLPKDRLMAELLQSHGDIILSHHQHDSLLQNQEDQELTEEERKAAWTEFENEKTQVPATNYSLGAMASLMVEIRTKLKMQNPTWTDEQILAGTMQVIQRLPDFPNMAPYFNMYQQQLSAAAQARPQGMAPGTNPMFPGVRMPTFQYPQFNNNAAMPTMQMANFARMANPGNSQNNFPGLNLHQLLMSNYANSASSNSSMVANPKHASGPVIQTVRSLQKVAPDTTTSSTGTNARTAETASSVVLDDSDPTVILD